MENFRELSRKFMEETIKGNSMIINDSKRLISDAFWYNKDKKMVSAIMNSFCFQDDYTLRVITAYWKESMGVYHMETRYLSPKTIRQVHFLTKDEVSHVLL